MTLMSAPKIITEMERQIKLGSEFPFLARQSLEACGILLDLLKAPLMQRSALTRHLQLDGSDRLAEELVKLPEEVTLAA